MHISERTLNIPTSPIRKLAPIADAAEKAGKKIYHLNIGQPDVETPKSFFEATAAFHPKVLSYGKSQGREELLEAIRNTRGTVVTYENHSITGGLGSAVAEFMAQEGIPVQLKRVGIPDIYAQSGSLSYLLEKCGMDAASLERILRELL